MGITETLFDRQFVLTLGWTLIHFMWQGAAVAILYAAISTLLRRRSANSRYGVACAALLLMMALPLVTFFIIESKIGGTEKSRTATVAVETNASSSSLSVPQSEEAAATFGNMESSEPDGPSFIGQWGAARFGAFLPWLVSAWLLGVLVLSLRLIGGLALMRRLKKVQTRPLLQSWQKKVNSLCEQIRVSVPVRLCESALVEIPTVIGWMRPIILLPASALTGLSPQHLEALLAHELAHIRRYDYLVNLVQSVIEILLFYHPSVWWISEQIRQERENCCDDLAVATCGSALVYARALTNLEEIRGSRVQLAVAANGGALLSRIQRLMGRPAPVTNRGTSRAAGLIIMMAPFVVFAAAQTTILSKQTRAAVTQSAAVSTVEQTRATTMPLSVEGGTQSSQADVKPTPFQPQHDDEIRESDVFSDLSDKSEETQVSLAARPDTRVPQSPAVKAAEEGFDNLSADEIASMEMHGITSELLRELRSLGYERLSIKQLVAFNVEGVTASYIRQITELIGAGISPDELIGLRVQGVSQKFIKDLFSLGYTSLSADQLISFKVQGVNVRFIKDMQALGYNLTAEQLVQFMHDGITRQYIESLRAKGYADLSPESILRLRQDTALADRKHN